VPVLLLLVALAVLAAIALVAAGHGNGLDDAPPDLAPFGMPEEPLRPGDLADVGFAAAFRGYRMEQVDHVLDRLALELAARDLRIAQLESALAGAEPAVDATLDPIQKEPGDD
jgi:DivIVA domain-containing protein